MPGYRIEFEQRASSDLERMPPMLASRILDWLEECAQSPVSHALKPSFPHVLKPKFQTSIESEHVRHFVVAIFQYGQDEESIIINQIVVQTI